MYPAALIVSSNGPAGHGQSSKMGVYLKQDSQQSNSRPVYKLERGGQYLYYDDFGYWKIGPTAGGSSGGISTLQKGLLMPPATGWKYWLLFGWNEDPQLTVKESSKDPQHLALIQTVGDKHVAKLLVNNLSRPSWRNRDTFTIRGEYIFSAFI